MTTYTIELENWAATGNLHNSRVFVEGRPANALNNTVGMCCLGFIAAHYIPEKYLWGEGMPNNLPCQLQSLLPDWLLPSEHLNAEYTGSKAAGINDAIEEDAGEDLAERINRKMTRLGALFATEKIRIRFVLHGWIVLHDNASQMQIAS